MQLIRLLKISKAVTFLSFLQKISSHAPLIYRKYLILELNFDVLYKNQAKNSPNKNT